MVVVEVAADLGVPLLASAAGTGGSRCRRRAAFAARSRIRCRARSGIRWTKPSTSWFESRKPMPRPIPVSNRLAERDRLKVAMHWYWFQVFSIRRRCGSGHSTWNRDSSPSQNAASRGQRLVDRRGIRVAVEQLQARLCPALVDVGEQEGEGLLRAGLEPQVDLVRANRVPAVRDASGGAAGERHRGLVQPVMGADEGIARRVEAGDVPRAAEQRHMVPPLAELRRVEDRRSRALDVDLPDRVRALEVRHVVQRLVEAELDVGEEAHLLRSAARVAHGRPPHLDVVAGRHEEAELDLDAVLRSEDARVAEPVPALVTVEVASWSASSRGSRRCRRRGRRGSGRQSRAARRCSGSGSAAATARHARTCSRRRCSCRGRRGRPGRDS